MTNYELITELGKYPCDWEVKIFDPVDDVEMMDDESIIYIIEEE